jgi:hypothetical protein
VLKVSVNNRIKEASKLGIKIKRVADMAGVSYYRLSSVANPDKYRSESRFDDFETKRINDALDKIKNNL